MLAYIPWYPQDILSDPRVNALTIAEEGAFRRLLDVMWVRASGICAIEDDELLCARNTKSSILIWRRVRDKLITLKLLKLKDGYLYSQRLSLEYSERARIASEKAKGGRESARKRLAIKGAAAGLLQDSSNYSTSTSTSSLDSAKNLEIAPSERRKKLNRAPPQSTGANLGVVAPKDSWIFDDCSEKIGGNGNLGADHEDSAGRLRARAVKNSFSEKNKS